MSDNLSAKSNKPPIINNKLTGSALKQPKSTTQLFKQSSPSNRSELLFVEDYFAEMDDLFIKDEFRPYLEGVFADFAMRSTPSASQAYPGKSIDKVTFMEYTNLPGILSDRFYILAKKDRTDNRIYEDDFISTMLSVFSGSLDSKLQFVF